MTDMHTTSLIETQLPPSLVADLILEVKLLAGHLETPGSDPVMRALRIREAHTLLHSIQAPCLQGGDAEAEGAVIANYKALLAALRAVVEMEYDRDEESRNFDEERLEYFTRLIAQADRRRA